MPLLYLFLELHHPILSKQPHSLIANCQLGVAQAIKLSQDCSLTTWFKDPLPVQSADPAWSMLLAE